MVLHGYTFTAVTTKPPMKITVISIALSSLLSFSMNAQFYGTYWSAYPATYELGNGFATNAAPGYFWLGYLGTVQNVGGWTNANKNFHIQGLGISAISAAYQVFDAAECGNNYTQIMQAYGVNCIECNANLQVRYAVAGAYKHGIYFVTLNSLGGVVSSMLYPFPGSPSLNAPTPVKPLIVQEQSTGNFYICGSFDEKMYVIKVNASGNIIWSSYYEQANQTVTPRDMILSPYGGNHLVVAGKVDVAQQSSEGFVCMINNSTGNANSTKFFHTPSGTNDEFATITAATGSGKGFVLGGHSGQYPSTTAPAWLIKTDTMVNSVFWSRFLHPASGANNGIIKVLERQNTAGVWELYALVKSSSGMVVLKLDATGTPFPTASGQFNEFIYDLPSPSPAVPVSISFINGSNLNPNAGLQVFGTEDNWPGWSSSYFVNAYFNGVSNCFHTLTNIPEWNSVFTDPVVHEFLRTGDISECASIQVTTHINLQSPNMSCTGSIAWGSNQKSAATNLQEEDGVPFIQVAPNPVVDHAAIRFSVAADKGAKVYVNDLLGNTVSTLVLKEMQDEVSIDFESLGVTPGVYLVTTKFNGALFQSKFVYTK
jgi:hypothetical protein